MRYYSSKLIKAENQRRPNLREEMIAGKVENTTRKMYETGSLKGEIVITNSDTKLDVPILENILKRISEEDEGYSFSEIIIEQRGNHRLDILVKIEII